MKDNDIYYERYSIVTSVIIYDPDAARGLLHVSDWS